MWYYIPKVNAHQTRCARSLKNGHNGGNAYEKNDFALSVNSETPSSIGYILFGIWLVGILAMIILVIKSSIRLQNLKKSALPLQNP